VGYFNAQFQQASLRYFQFAIAVFFNENSIIADVSCSALMERLMTLHKTSSQRLFGLASAFPL
jgi:hypothetical protein